MARTADIEKRQEIAEAAVRYLREQGARRVTMSELARALGMKRSTFYWYFSDLASIFEVALEQLFAEQDAFVAAEVGARGASHPIDLIGAYIEAVHAFYQGREEQIVFLFQFWAAGNPEAPDRTLTWIRGRYLPRREQAVAMVRAGIEQGLVAPCDPEALIGLVGAMTDGLLIQRLIADAPLAPIHTLIWKDLLEPLKRAPSDTVEEQTTP